MSSSMYTESPDANIGYLGDDQLLRNLTSQSCRMSDDEDATSSDDQGPSWNAVLISIINDLGDDGKWMGALERLNAEDMSGDDIVQSGQLDLFCTKMEHLLGRPSAGGDGLVCGILQSVVEGLQGDPSQAFKMLRLLSRHVIEGNPAAGAARPQAATWPAAGGGGGTADSRAALPLVDLLVLLPKVWSTFRQDQFEECAREAAPLLTPATLQHLRHTAGEHGSRWIGKWLAAAKMRSALIGVWPAESVRSWLGILCTEPTKLSKEFTGERAELVDVAISLAVVLLTGTTGPKAVERALAREEPCTQIGNDGGRPHGSEQCGQSEEGTSGPIGVRAQSDLEEAGKENAAVGLGVAVDRVTWALLQLLVAGFREAEVPFSWSAAALKGLARLVDEHTQEKPLLLPAQINLVWNSVAAFLPLPQNTGQPDPQAHWRQLAPSFNAEGISQPMARGVLRCLQRLINTGA
eukprot:jgi/Botrbrau1/455/Bobra.110_2s0101.2